jgi:hypothetical protein
MSERNSRVVSIRMPLQEYAKLASQAHIEHRTIGGLALELMRQASK